MSLSLERISISELPEKIRLSQPAIVIDLLRGRQAERITRMDEAREMIGAMNISIGLNYVDGHMMRIHNYLRGIPMPKKLAKRPGKFADYLDLVAREPDTRSVISEEPAPAELIADVDLRAIGVDKVIAGAPDEEIPPNVAYCLIFAANRGNSSDMHVDGDGRDVLLYQGFGRKRVVLFPPSAAPHLHPIANFSTVRLARMSEAERCAFVAFAGGVEHILIPGEAVFMPALIWHHFDYLDCSLSLVVRFGGVCDPEAKALLRNVHFDHYIQNILAGTRDPKRSGKCRAAARRLVDAARRRYPSTQAKYRAMRALAIECHRSTLGEQDEGYLPCIVGAEDFLGGALSGFYSRAPKGTALAHRIWTVKEHTRDRLRRLGRKLSFWA
jgi:hypothetical protein